MYIPENPLYRKVIYFRNLIYTGEIFDGKLEIQNVENYCKCEVYQIYNDGEVFEYYRASNGSGEDYFLDYWIRAGFIRIYNKIYNLENFDYMIIIEYTKTTD